MTYNIENQVNSVKSLTRIGNFHEKELESIIKLPTGRPDRVAEEIYTNIKGLFKRKRDGSSKIKTRAYQTSYKQIAKATHCCIKTAKRKVSLLESLGLISRGVTDEIKYGRLHNNILNIFVWKKTPHFILAEGLEKTPEDLEKISKLHGKKMIVENGIILPESMGKKFPHPPGKKFPDHISNTTINTTIIDNHDHQHNQFFTSKNLGTENVETLESKMVNSEIVGNSERWLAEEEVVVSTQDKNNSVELVKSAESLTETQNITSDYQKTKETIGRDGKKYQSPYLSHFKFDDKTLNLAISRSNKKHYTPQKVWIIIRNLLEKKPNTLIYGGRRGAINYLAKAIDGENDYDYQKLNPQSKEEKAVSMAEIKYQRQLDIKARIAKGGIEWT